MQSILKFHKFNFLLQISFEDLDKKVLNSNSYLDISRCSVVGNRMRSTWKKMGRKTYRRKVGRHHGVVEAVVHGGVDDVHGHREDDG